MTENWNPTKDATLSQAVGEALGSASMCWENPAGAGVFDSSQCGEVYDGLMAYLSDWADEHRKEANEATWAKGQVVTKEWSDIAYEMYAMLCNSKSLDEAHTVAWQGGFERLKERFHAALATLPEPGQVEP